MQKLRESKRINRESAGIIPSAPLKLSKKVRCVVNFIRYNDEQAERSIPRGCPIIGSVGKVATLKKLYKFLLIVRLFL